MDKLLKEFEVLVLIDKAVSANLRGNFCKCHLLGGEDNKCHYCRINEALWAASDFIISNRDKGDK